MRRQGAGFSITELMVVVAIVAILLGIGIPSYRYITNSYRMSAEVNGLLGDLQYARAEAIKEGQTVTACVSNTGTSCTGETDWATGWVVFSDPTAGQTVTAGVLRVQKGFTGTPSDAFNANPNVTAITFNREGFATTTAGFAGTLITLHDSTGNAAWTRCLSISPVGVVAVQTHLSDPGTCT